MKPEKYSPDKKSEKDPKPAMECRRCGVCCTMHQSFVTPRDIDRIIAYLGITPKEWDELYDDPRWRFTEYRLIRHINGACAFLTFDEGISACRIHAVKPACCARWQAGPARAECQKGLAKTAAENQPPAL